MFVRRAMQLSAAGLVAIIAACGGGGGGNNPPQIPPVTATMNVSVVNNTFTPPNAGIASGNTVTWTWNSAGVQHNVAFATGPTIPPGSGVKDAGTYQVTFTNPGVYYYVCSLHSNMEGYVTVN
jgi:plastocyanin